MPVTHLEFNTFPQFSAMDLAYATERAGLKNFYKYEPELASFAQAITDKQKDNTDRTLLVERLMDQYEAIGVTDKRSITLVKSLANSETFTITTAHQPSLFTGPLYFIYKAFSAIKLAQMLAEEYPQNTFVPLFILGGEDHDFEEVNHLFLKGKRITWSNDETGSVSRMRSKSVEAALQEVLAVEVTNSHAQESLEYLAQAFSKFETYGQAMASWVQHLLGEYGILIFNMDDPHLKRAMIPIFKKEILDQPSLPLVQESQQKLTDAGYGNQAYSRPINLFYMTDGIRERIEKVEDQYTVLNTDLSFSEQELLSQLETYPERFSPNVILRPIYQESILPNLAYVGGGGELAYWLERQTQFDHYGLNFPMLVRRDSAIWLSHRSQRKLKKLGLRLDDLAQRPEQAEKRYIAEHAITDFDIAKERAKFESGFSDLEAKANAVDPTLGPMVGAQATKMLKQIDHIGGKLRKAEKEKHRHALDELHEIRNELFPKNGLQERRDNFLNVYLSEGRAFFDLLLESFDPLDTRMKILLPK